MRTRLVIGSVTVALCMAGVRIAWSAKDDKAAGGDGTREAVLPAHGFAGTMSCSAAACHGKAEPIVIQSPQQNEYTYCMAHDRHTQAYAVLLEGRAKLIAQNLSERQQTKYIAAHEDERCLACHTTPQAAKLPSGQQKADDELVSWRLGGVSCEACHGPALQKDKPWLALHTTATWRTMPSRAKAQHGMTPVADLKVQAKVCAGCHVGAASSEGVPARDLNHDLMAAGHPRLTFELASFRANYPAHWNVRLKNERIDVAARDAEAWAIGRVAAARAALELLVHRAEESARAKKSPGSAVRWPEFAEYRCLACHADFNEFWRLRERDPNRATGSLPYDAWHYTLLPELSSVGGGVGFESNLKEPYDKLIAEMARPDPDEKAVIDMAKKLLTQFDAVLNSTTPPPQSFAKDMGAKLAASKTAVPRTWEETTQLALAATALQPNSQAALAGLFDALAYPHKDDSGPAGFLGPPNARKSVQDAFPKLLEILKK